MKMQLGALIGLAIILVSAAGYLRRPMGVKVEDSKEVAVREVVNTQFDSATDAVGILPEATLPVPDVPARKTLANDYHIFQTFNNCGPAAFSMALSYYGVTVSQKDLGEALRPYQNPQGDNDDKSVTLGEIADKAGAYGLTAYHRPAGSTDLLKKFISQDMPVITRTWLHAGEDIGHFRIVKGYDDAQGVIIQDDSYQGKNLEFSYADFEELWQAFNYEYLVLVPKDKVEIIRAVLESDLDERAAWEKAARNNMSVLADDPDDIYARFNLSVAKYYLGDYAGSVKEYEAVADKLPGRMLWYQIEPIRAYFELGDYQKVMVMTTRILNDHNRAFSELYQLRGRVYLKQDDPGRAGEEFTKALQYNKHYSLSDDEAAYL